MPSDSNHFSESRPHPLIGKTIGVYRIVEPIGRGGMGFVFKARHEIMNRDVAIKLLSPQVATDEIGIKRIRREASAMGSLQHPNIATIFDFGVSDDAQPFIVMEYIQGQTLKDLLKEQKRLTAERGLPIFARIADAMAFAHENGVIHRDLKPHNIMLSDTVEKDFVKVLDFGIAKSVNESVMLTQKGEVLGSPLYMSPEQCTGKSIDQRSDIYALGAIMYESITGKPPFMCSTIYETIYAKTTETPEPFLEVAPDLPNLMECQPLEELIMACLSISPYDRPSSMSELKVRLAAAGSLLGITMTSSTVTSAIARVEPTEPDQTKPAAPVEITAETVSIDQQPEPESGRAGATQETSTVQIEKPTLPDSLKSKPVLAAGAGALLIAVCAALAFAFSSAFNPGKQAADAPGSPRITQSNKAPAGDASPGKTLGTVRHSTVDAMESAMLEKQSEHAEKAPSGTRRAVSAAGSLPQETGHAPPLAPPIGKAPPARNPAPPVSQPVSQPKLSPRSSGAVSREDVRTYEREARKSYKHNRRKFQEVRGKVKSIWKNIKSIGR
ncbi:MAG: serine/threonine protein kinase [Candidatus Melainabacteria bacterium]|nr:serine/threonine protein kinase [Candidatus Melainabacteria bacterium]